MSEFNCCPLNLMLCSKKALHKLNRLSDIHERSLRLRHQDHASNFITLLVNANEKSIHQQYSGLEGLRKVFKRQSAVTVKSWISA